jgi:transcriptional antiterminator RfaH
MSNMFNPEWKHGEGLRKPADQNPGRLSSDKGSAQAWVVVNTLPHREEKALEHLGRQGFHAYCPMIRRRVKHARSMRHVLRPLFPGYIFVYTTRDLPMLRPVLSTVGVRTLVRFGNQIGFLDPRFIEALKDRETDGVNSWAANSYEPGQRVRIEGGAFDGLVATIIEMDEKNRLIVLMDLLNRLVKVKVEGEAVIAD